MNTDQIDKLGQAAFSKLCHKDNLIVNSSKDHDHAGWDYVIESKLITKEGDFLSACYVQLKTTTYPPKKSWGISLSNLYRLSKQHAPCFYCLIILDNDGEMAEAYLRLLDEELMKKIVDKVNSPITKMLHEMQISVSFKPEHKINVKNGETITSRIIKLIGNDYSKYVNEKEQFFKTVGLEENIIINFSSIEEVKEFVYLLLGYKKQIQLKDASLVKQRFQSNENLKIDGSTLSLKEVKATWEGSVQLYLENTPQLLIFNVKFYTLPKTFFGSESELIRVEATYFDIFFNPRDAKNANAEFKYDFTKLLNLNLNEYIKTTKLAFLLQKNPNNAELLFKLSSGKTFKTKVNLEVFPHISQEHIQFIERFKVLSDHVDLVNHIKLKKKDIMSVDIIHLYIANHVIENKLFSLESTIPNILNNKFIVKFNLTIANCEIVFVFTSVIKSKDNKSNFEEINYLKSFVIIEKDSEGERSVDDFIETYTKENPMELLIL